MEKVSIVVSIYNAEKYLAKMLDSLAMQTYPKQCLEIILVNDGSTDSSPQICEKYCQQYDNFRYVSKQNGGISSARNAGLDVATGKYITFFDSDDVCEPTYVEKMATAMEKTGVGLCCCGINETTKNNVTSYGYQKNTIFGLEDKDTYVDFFNTYWLPVVWNKMYVKDLITERFDEKISYDEDTVFNLHYLKNVKNIVCLKDPLYHYLIREKSNSLTAQGKKDIFEKSKVTNKYRIELSEQLFNDKKCVYVACRKLIKAIFQEAQTNQNSGMNRQQILDIIKTRLADPEVQKSFSYFTPIFDQDMVIKDIIENNDAEKLLDCATNGFDKYLDNQTEL